MTIKHASLGSHHYLGIYGIFNPSGFNGRNSQGTRCAGGSALEDQAVSAQVTGDGGVRDRIVILVQYFDFSRDLEVLPLARGGESDDCDVLGRSFVDCCWP